MICIWISLNNLKSILSKKNTKRFVFSMDLIHRFHLILSNRTIPFLVLPRFPLYPPLLLLERQGGALFSAWLFLSAKKKKKRKRKRKKRKGRKKKEVEKDGPGWKADIPIPTRFTIKITGGSFTWRNSNKDKVWDKVLCQKLFGILIIEY